MDPKSNEFGEFFLRYKNLPMKLARRAGNRFDTEHAAYQGFYKALHAFDPTRQTREGGDNDDFFEAYATIIIKRALGRAGKKERRLKEAETEYARQRRKAEDPVDLNPENYMHVADAAKLTGLSEDTLTLWANVKLPAESVDIPGAGCHWIFHKSDLEKLLKKKKGTT